MEGVLEVGGRIGREEEDRPVVGQHAGQLPDMALGIVEVLDQVRGTRPAEAAGGVPERKGVHLGHPEAVRRPPSVGQLHGLGAVVGPEHRSVLRDEAHRLEPGRTPRRAWARPRGARSPTGTPPCGVPAASPASPPAWDVHRSAACRPGSPASWLRSLVASGLSLGHRSSFLVADTKRRRCLHYRALVPEPEPIPRSPVASTPGSGGRPTRSSGRRAASGPPSTTAWSPCSPSSPCWHPGRAR